MVVPQLAFLQHPAAAIWCVSRRISIEESACLSQCISFEQTVLDIFPCGRRQFQQLGGQFCQQHCTTCLSCASFVSSFFSLSVHLRQSDAPASETTRWRRLQCFCCYMQRTRAKHSVLERHAFNALQMAAAGALDVYGCKPRQTNKPFN